MIREVTKSDFEEFWPCFERIIKAEETYAFEPDMNFQEAYQLWCKTPLKSFAFVEGKQVLGLYYIKANAQGPSNHICNCGYMVNEQTRGKGIAKKLCQHSQQMAVTLGFKAMQFNSVVSSNKVAVSLWQQLGFNIIGTIPLAYRHRRLGYIDSYVMHKQLRK
ncbi:GNAT family N-acetyltransferase [Neptunomonas japonica]|uniref:GNAT family N-acetyltransferase n=1 Tax=Neptunomonas japonica TaxID=417574 RepID=UPI0004901035|nr:GNAT family N-acetyltransferase [Neptunomonas japonica]